MRFVRLCMIFMCAFACAHAVAQSTPVDPAQLTKLTNAQATVAATFKSFNRVAKESLYDLQLSNVSGGVLHGPVYVTIEGLSPAGVQVKNPSGTTTSGVPYFVISAGDVAAGVQKTLPISFVNPQNAKLTFTLNGYATPVVTTPPPGGLTIEITRPATLITVGATPISIEGTVSDASATVTVNGAPVSVTGDKHFQANVALIEGHNAIIARAVKGTDEAAATISVSLDLTAPYVTIESPVEGQVLTSPTVNVAGLINDIVRGTVSEGQANVTVNGRPATVSNRSYFAADVPLQEGLNTIRVEGADQVGNVGVTQVHVTFQVPTKQFIQTAGGQAQQAQIRDVLPQSLAVKLVTASGQPVPSKPVVFRVTEGDGQVGIGGSDAGKAVLVVTDGNGIASTRYRLGSRAGSGNNHVSAKAVGFEGEVTFVASATPKPGNKVSVNSGNNQRGAAKQPLPLPFVVVVTDEGANVIEGAPIDFAVTAGTGTFQNGQTHFTATTDSDGRASAKLTLGPELGLDVQRVTATLTGTSLTAGFTASALQSGAAGATSISGVVLDNQDHPLPNVTMRVDGTTREAKSDAQGRFKITEAPVGPVHLIADGSTTTMAGEWPTLSYNFVTVSGADNPLSAPVYLVKLDTAHAVTVGTEDKEITLSEVPGFKLTVKAGSVTFPNGDKTGQISVTPVNASKIPMAPPNGMQPQFIVTIQPTGTRFDPPAALQLPNVDGHAAGAQVEMYSFDHDLEEFVSIGLGTVSADGTVIKSNPGIGVIKAGWHCGSQPGGNGCASSCPICQTANADCSACIANDGDTRVLTQDQFDDCKKPICSNGHVVQVADASDDPVDAIHNDCHKSTCAGPLAIDDSDLPVDICKTCKDGEIVDAGSQDASLTNVSANVEGIAEKWKFMRDGKATFSFTANSTRKQCADVTYEWDFGDPFDPTPGSGQFASHTYTQPDHYTITVKVTCSGCTQKLSQTATTKVTALQIVHETLANAANDPNGEHNDRLKIGIGEEVQLITVPSVQLFWSADGGSVSETDAACDQSTCGSSQLFKAASTASTLGSAGDIFVSKPPMLESTLALSFNVIPPSDLRWRKVKALSFPSGTAAAAMLLQPVFVPLDVSFENVEFHQESGGAINRTGYFATLDPTVPVEEGGLFFHELPDFLSAEDTVDLVEQQSVPRNIFGKFDKSRYSVVVGTPYRIRGETETHHFLWDGAFWSVDVEENGTVTIEKGFACVSRLIFDFDQSEFVCGPELIK